MPLTLKAPRIGKSPNWTIRGTYLGVEVDRTTGTDRKEVARKILKKIESEIERGSYAPAGAPTFEDACITYLRAGGDATFVGALKDHLGRTLLAKIGQEQIDAAAVALYPHGSPATRNRQVYTPMSAILKAAGIDTPLKRPKGSRGRRRLFFLQVEQAERVIDATYDIDEEFGIFCLTLLYTGCRLNELLGAQIEAMNLTEAWAFVAETKNDDPRLVHLPPVVVAEIANHPRGVDRKGKLFRFSKCGRLYTWLNTACERAGVALPPRLAFHVFRHTWGAWMRRYAGLDTTGLVATGAWRDRQAASIYEHAIASEEAMKSDLLPVVGRTGKIRGKASA